MKEEGGGEEAEGGKEGTARHVNIKLAHERKTTRIKAKAKSMPPTPPPKTHCTLTEAAAEAATSAEAAAARQAAGQNKSTERVKKEQTNRNYKQKKIIFFLKLLLQVQKFKISRSKQSRKIPTRIKHNICIQLRSK